MDGLRRRIAVGTAILAALAVPGMVVLVGSGVEPEPSDAELVKNRPAEMPADGYVSAATCRKCHPHQHETWHASYHRTMTQVASPESVIGRFDAELPLDGLTFQLQRRDDRYWARVFADGRPGGGLESEIVLTTGSHHMQVYWTSLHGSRALSALPFVYLREEERWIPRRSAFLQTPTRRASAEVARWNGTCLRCHTTHGRMRPGELVQQTGIRSESVDTHVAEFGISCEACHGPGHDHLAANQNPLRRYQLHFDSNGDDTIVHPGRLGHDRASQLCGHCHSVTEFRSDPLWAKWTREGFEFRPGDDLEKSELRYVVRHDMSPMPEPTRKMVNDHPHYLESLFWPDGMVRVTGREYNGLSKSPCYERGTLSCMSCHQMHQSMDDPRPRREWADDQLKFGFRGNRACLQCHEEFEAEAALVAHTHHPASSSGSNCYNCHMPFTTYGLLKAIRSHQIDSPSVHNSLATRRPNACNQCHLDQSLQWTAGHLADWYGHEIPEMSKDQKEVAAAVLWLLQGDAGQRALMAWSLGWEAAREISGPEWMAPYAAVLCTDRFEAVRLIAERSLKRLPGFGDASGNVLGPTQEVAAYFQSIMADWEARPKNTPPERAKRVLIDQAGKIDKGRFESLYSERHDPDLQLLE